MLDHVDDMRQRCAPHEGCLGNDKGQPEGFVPKSNPANQANADGCKGQFHLEAAVQGPADACGNFIGIDEVAEQTARNRKPA